MLRCNRFLISTYLHAHRDPSPCLGELKNTIRSWILGMGPLNVDKIKSICITGPPGCGKKHIVWALADELNAVIFNLTPEIVAKYKDNLKYFLHLVNKMSRILQPTILFIDGAHKPFIKKVSVLLNQERNKVLNICVATGNQNIKSM